MNTKLPFDDVEEFSSIINSTKPKSNLLVDEELKELNMTTCYQEGGELANRPSVIIEDIPADQIEEVVGIDSKHYNDVMKTSEELVTVETKLEVKKTFNNLYRDLNEKYNLNLRMDSESFSELMQNISDPKMNKALQLYTSELFGRFRSIIYNKYLQALAALSNQILDPEFILSESISYDDKLSIMERLFKFMTSIEQIYSTVNIENSDMKLSHLSDDAIEGANINDPETRSLLNKLLGKE